MFFVVVNGSSHSVRKKSEAKNPIDEMEIQEEEKSEAMSPVDEMEIKEEKNYGGRNDSDLEAVKNKKGRRNKSVRG